MLTINFGISEIFAILNYPNLVICISNVTAIDYNILVYNFTFKVKYRQNWRVIPSLLAINFGICEIFAILYYLNLDICIDNVSAIDCSILVQNFTFKVKYRHNWREIPSLLAINFGISEIFAILNYPNLVICISNVTAIDYNILVYNFTFKVKYRQNWRVIPSFLAINFGICEIFAILYYLNLDICIDNVSAIDCSILVYNFTFKVKYRQNWREIPSLLAINFGICEIFAILYYLNLDTCIDNVSAIDCSILVQNFSFKVKYRQNQIEIPSLLMITFGISEIFAILNYPNLVICISNVTAIDYNILVYNFTFKVKYRQNWRVIPSLLAINFGICEIFAILYYLNLDTCIDNVSAIDCSILVQNFTFKVKYRQNQIEIPSLLMITFGISEIFAILNYPNLVICISNVTAIDYNILVYNLHLKLNSDKTEGLFQVCSRSILG